MTIRTMGLLSVFALSCASSTAQGVYDKLVAAQCLAPSSDGVQAISSEHADPSQPDWLACMFDGGTVQSCNVPCE
jgi:hypothetical protein